MRIFGNAASAAPEFVAVFRENRAHGPKAGRKRLAACSERLRGALGAGEQVNFITSTDAGIVAVTDERAIVVSGQEVAAFSRAAVEASVETSGGQRHVAIRDGARAVCDPVRFLDGGEAEALVAALQLPPLLSPEHEAELERVGRAAFGGPYPGAGTRVVRPSGAELLAALDDGRPSLEPRLSRELLGLEDGWKLGGALVLAAALPSPPDSLIDRGTRFLLDHGVPAGLLPDVAVQRWVAVHGAPPESAEALPDVQLGELLLRKGDVDGAQAAYERAADAGEIEALHRLGGLFEDHRSDDAAAEAAWRRADEAGSLNGAGNLARLLEARGDLAGAEAAYRRCVERGSLRALGGYGALLMRREDATAAEIAELTTRMCAAEDLFVLHQSMEVGPALIVFSGMWELCDPSALELGVRRADQDGSATGAYHLGLVLRDRGDVEEALTTFLRAAERGYGDAWVKAAGEQLRLGDVAGAIAIARKGEAAGEPSSTAMLGAILDEQGDSEGALDAYRRADAAGDPNGAYNLAIDLEGRGDLAGSLAAFERAAERGADNADAAVSELRRRIAVRDESRRRDPRAAGRRDLSLAAPVLHVLSHAPGDNDRMHAAIAQLLHASNTPEMFSMHSLDEIKRDREAFVRPWRWLNAVAHQALEERQPELAAQAFIFTSVWRYGVMPTLQGNVGFDAPPETDLRGIATAGVAALRRLAPEHVVATDGEGVAATAGALRDWPLAAQYGS